MEQFIDIYRSWPAGQQFGLLLICVLFLTAFVFAVSNAFVKFFDDQPRVAALTAAISANDNEDREDDDNEKNDQKFRMLTPEEVLDSYLERLSLDFRTTGLQTQDYFIMRAKSHEVYLRSIELKKPILEAEIEHEERVDE